MSLQYSAILFDFDFTLGDSSVGICESVNHALRTLGHEPASDDAIHRMIGLPLKTICQRFTGSDDEHSVTRFKQHFYEVASTRVVETSSLYPGVEDMLRSLHGVGHRLGVVSTKSRVQLVQILERLGVAPTLSVVVGGDDVTRNKPDPEGLVLAAARLGIEPRTALYVGDTIHDAEAAAGAGMDFVAVLSGTTTEPEFSGYDAVAILPSVTELALRFSRG